MKNMYRNNLSPAIHETISDDDHKKRLTQSKKIIEAGILQVVPSLIQTMIHAALPHEVLHIREYNEDGEFLFERRVTNQEEIAYIKANADRKLYRLEYYAGNADIAERLINRAIGTPKVNLDITTDNDKVDPEKKKKNDEVLDSYLSGVFANKQAHNG